MNQFESGHAVGRFEQKRLHPVAALLGFLGSVRSLLPVMIVAAITQRDESGAGPLVYIFLPLLLSLSVGIGQWARFRYWIEDGELRVERGLFIRRRVFISHDRIQAIDVSSGLLLRVFGLVSVQIKTAAQGTQAALSAISASEAERLRRVLSSASDGAPHGRSDEPLDPDQVHGGARRYVLSKKRLVVAASTSGRVGVLLSAIAWLYSQLDEVVNERLIQFTEAANLSGAVVLPGPAIVVIGALGALLLAWLVSVVAELARFGGFSVERRGQRIIIARGLVERREVAIRLERVQAVLIVESLLRQPLGYATLVIESAGHSEERGQSTQLHPLLRRDEIQAFLKEIVPNLAIETRLEKPPRRALPRFLVKPALTTLGLIAGLSLINPWAWALSPLLVGTLLLGVLSYCDAGAATVGRALLLRYRTLQRTTVIVERRRIQFARVSQSWFQRRRRVSNLTVGVASGAAGLSHTAPELDEASALELLAWYQT